MFFIVFKNYFYLIHNITMFEFLCPHMQGTIVPKRTLGPFLTLSAVRNGHKLKLTGFLGSQPISRVKVDN